MRTIVVVFAIFSIHCSAQNLVPNPSFEDTTSSFCGIMFTIDFSNSLNNWTTPSDGNPDVYYTTIDNTCYNYQPNSQYTGPIGLKGNQIPRSGDVMCGIWIYTIPGLNQREYLQVRLTSPMISGECYIVSFWASLGDFMESSSNKLSAYLSVTQVGTTGQQVISASPQLQSSGYLTDVQEWQLIRDTICATANYEYLTIGNFYDDANCINQPNSGASGLPGTYGAYYFIDDVSVIELNASMSEDNTLRPFKVYPNPATSTLYIETSPATDISILDVSGRIVPVKINSENGLYSVDISHLPQGLYLVKTIDNQGTNTQLFMKE